ncbi:AAA family ATPase [Streptomyces sp. A13(2022)]|uniref:AAA family ATPase n=1 Tax=Streptomyces sp. A13(2022) TaxID=2964768 RepID=UPI0021D9B38B|nr:AAA family ATPase [Streptomyces sp. A13(2022)]MCU8591990.1 AAA family ATPase [Streptomyces sp. A13(2022)]
MYLKNLRLRNIRSFHGGRKVDLDLTRPDGSYAGWTVLAGRNGSGKTTLLRALALAISGPAVARSLVPGFETWVSRGEQVAKAEVCLVHDPEQDQFTAGRRPALPIWAGLRWTASNDGSLSGKPGSSRTGSQPSLMAIGYQKERPVAARGPWADNPVGWFCAGYGPFRRLAGGSSDIQRLMSTSGGVARLTSLFHEDASLAEGVGWLIEQHLRAFENREGARDLKAAALAILGDDLLPDDYRIDGVDSEGLWVTNRDHKFPLREMSDGYRTVAALVVDILKQIHDAYDELVLDLTDGAPKVPSAGIVIIDEIDAHLHVSWQKRIGGWLKDHFPNIQFIVTTHSPYICQAADPGGLIRLPGPDEDEPVEVVPQPLYDRIVFGSGDDAVLSDLFGLDTPYSEQAEQKREELIALELDVVRGRASEEEKAQYRALKLKLTSSPAARVDEIAARRLAGRPQDES